MRVSNTTLRNNVMRNLQLSLRELAKVQRQMASGQKINKPSDSPVAVTKLLNLSSALAESNQLQANVRDALGWLEVTDSTLNSVGEVFHRAKDLALAGANGTLPQDARDYNAREVDQILRHVIALANTSFDGNRHIFGGTHYGGVPFTVTEGADGFVESVDSQAGAGLGVIRYEIIRNIDMQVNTEGHKLFVEGGLFSSLMAIRDGLLGKVDLQDAIGQLEQGMNRLLDERATVGARYNRLEMTDRRYQEETVTLTQLKSHLGDIDMAEAIMNYSTRAHVYQAALAAGARVMQPTLLDYLR